MKRILLVLLVLLLASCKQTELISGDQPPANVLMIQDACMVNGEPVILEMGYDSLVWLWYIYKRVDGTIVGVSAYADGEVRNVAYIAQGVCAE